ncbi:carbon-monoxide dehydrogenase medium subunit [Haloactinopolyspora alba]|uniref:Carbon-monoxide dehydrogenase medium subunit n=1 Tax=Haloactinopolyspora alba TaxID=648780 RepID=A0A2P8E3G6_9ACTN|nr:FAD binding domain-containing protein [Haloactinopolyspora alba]PSL04004.1 carbon-monoxide dehydrogenase medium subunit [Haloactinopolyspora alba]
MKPSAFAYHRPGTVDEAVATLAGVGDDGKVLAGGQSLVPMLNMRLAAPAHLVDVNRVDGLDEVRVVDDGAGASVRVGAAARHTDVEHDAEVAAVLPLLRQALEHVAHPTIRNRGTTVGSLVHADPAAELNAVLALLGGSVTLRSTTGSRVVNASELVTGPMQTCLRPDELATEAAFPVPQGHTGTAWTEVSRRAGDYAVCGVGVLVTVDDELRVRSARAAYVSMGPVPEVLDLTEPVAGIAAGGARPDEWAAAGRLATARLEPDDDIHATAAYRGHLAGVLTARAARAAAERAVARAGDTTGAST